MIESITCVYKAEGSVLHIEQQLYQRGGDETALPLTAKMPFQFSVYASVFLYAREFRKGLENRKEFSVK